MNRSGQIITEFLIGTLLLLLPLVVGAGAWFNYEWDRSKCCYQTFFSARRQLIQTRRDVDKTAICDGSTERVQLKALESLDEAGFILPGLNQSALDGEVNLASRLSAQVLRLLLPRSDLDSTVP